MNEAVRFAKEIIRKRKATYKTKSALLRRDYHKSISKDMKDLLFYCSEHGLNITSVMCEAAKEK